MALILLAYGSDLRLLMQMEVDCPNKWWLAVTGCPLNDSCGMLLAYVMLFTGLSSSVSILFAGLSSSVLFL